MTKRIVSAVLGGAALIGGLAACGSTHAASTAAASTATAPASQAAPPPAPVASPDGTYNGSCDYTLGSDPVGGFGPGTARLIGEIDLANTGNVGYVAHTRITWPQEAAAPITARKTIRLPYGASKVVRFSVPMTGDQVDLLQSWQERHGFKDGCTYHVAQDLTFGAVHA